MLDREELKTNFLQRHNINALKIEKLPADASFRSYERLIFADYTMMLMNAPPDKEKVVPFIEIDEFLYANNFSVPKISYQDKEHGFLLIEDFGDDSYSKLLKKDAELEEYLYLMAVNALCALHKIPAPKDLIPGYDQVELMREAMLFIEWYIPSVSGDKLPENLVIEYKEIFLSLIPHLQVLESVMVLRDYHADNLMWLEDREGIARVGMLDFQDAVIGSPIYDIMSLLSDVRRDVSAKTTQEMINHFLELNSHINRKDFLASYAILSAQRNLKIIGIVARKMIRDKTSAYLYLLPRAWGHLEESLRHPLLLPLKRWLDKLSNLGIRSNGFKKI
jgi:aminoglycoside/choline kinase family phosphotransferase